MVSDGSATTTACDAVLDGVLEVASRHFSSELINRLDTLIVFNRLSKQNVHDVVSLRLRDVVGRTKDRYAILDMDGKSKEWLADAGYSDVYDARVIARVVR